MNYIAKYKEFQNKFNSDVENLYDQFIEEKGKILDQVYEIVNSYSEDIIEYKILLGNVDSICLECVNGKMSDLSISIEEKMITLTGKNYLNIFICAKEKDILQEIYKRLNSEFKIENLQILHGKYINDGSFSSTCYINI